MTRGEESRGEIEKRRKEKGQDLLMVISHSAHKIVVPSPIPKTFFITLVFDDKFSTRSLKKSELVVKR